MAESGQRQRYPVSMGNGLLQEILHNRAKQRLADKAKYFSSMDATKLYDSQEGTAMQNDSPVVASKSRRNPASTDKGSMPLTTMTSSRDCEISRESVTANVTSA
ncbi:hypothetical protein ACJMK2_028814 [Sinanodonta woodiana]|uniref:Uncharacterized protein n=1 Tax=Sinanodonta woodiana TaxID=1069815 RepID=A0ABD3X8S9_SINWO